MKTEEITYFFDGYKFIDFIDVNVIKSQLSQEYNLSKEELQKDFPQLYSHLKTNYPSKGKVLGKMFFENIFYSHLKNIFIDKISSHPNLEVDAFKKNVKTLIDYMNKKDTIPSQYYDYMSNEGFYLMDVLNITSHSTKFVAGLDYKEEEGKVTNCRILFVEVVPSKQKTIYFISGIELDFVNMNAITMVRNINQIDKSGENDTTVFQMRSSSNEMVFKKLNIELKVINVDEDRGKMYDFCKKLDGSLLDEIRDRINTSTDREVKKSVKNLEKVLFEDEKKLSLSAKEDLNKKIKVLLLANYIEVNMKNIDLVKKAKKLKLPGYPTRIKFTSSKLGKSSTQSSNSKNPVSASDMFHDLYFSFDKALSLDSWSISWFTDFKFSEEKDTEVVQTTIYSTKKNFRVVFLPTRPLDEEIVKNVIKKIIEKRE